MRATASKTKDGAPLPPIDELAKLTGDAKAGAAVFANAGGANCISCHQVGDKGQMLGPPLTTIGQKLSKAQLYEAILKPNAGILMGYENWVVRTKKGRRVSGLKTAETPDGDHDQGHRRQVPRHPRRRHRPAGEAEDLAHAGEPVADDDEAGAGRPGRVPVDAAEQVRVDWFVTPRTCGRTDRGAGINTPQYR